jgi:uncharacterized metal-binding protein YceD (DUF177 family)
MRVHIFDLKPDLSVHVAGTESWLDRIYADFPSASGASRPRVHGDLLLTLEEGGTVYVSGKLNFAPVIGCSRCDLGIPWPMSFDVGVRFFPSSVNAPTRERTLSQNDLDIYFLEDDEVDLETLVNDLVQTGMPSRVLATTDDGSACRICHADLTSAQVYGSHPAADAPSERSPFAALKDLKLPN